MSMSTPDKPPGVGQRASCEWKFQADLGTPCRLDSFARRGVLHVIPPEIGQGMVFMEEVGWRNTRIFPLIFPQGGSELKPEYGIVNV